MKDTKKKNRALVVALVLLALALWIFGWTRLHDASQPYGTYVAQVATSTTVTLELKKDAGHTAVLTKKVGVKTETKSGSWERTQAKEITVTLPDDTLVLKIIEDKKIKVVDGGDTLPDGTVFDQVPPVDDGKGGETATSTDDGRQGDGKGTDVKDTDVKDGGEVIVPPLPGGGIGGGQPPLKSGPYDGTVWQLVSYGGKAVEKGASYTLTFEGGTLSARFCNAPGGEYTVDGDIMTGTLMSTMMACDDQLLMEMESSFSSILAKGALVSMRNGTLTLTDGRNISFEYGEVKK